jgi:hypothetical protein
MSYEVEKNAKTFKLLRRHYDKIFSINYYLDSILSKD